MLEINIDHFYDLNPIEIQYLEENCAYEIIRIEFCINSLSQRFWILHKLDIGATIDVMLYLIRMNSYDMPLLSIC